MDGIVVIGEIFCCEILVCVVEEGEEIILLDYCVYFLLLVGRRVKFGRIMCVGL